MRNPPALAGRTVLVTRPEERERELVAHLAALGARVLDRPAITFEPAADPAPARRAVRELSTYDLLVFTSPTGVRFFVDRLRVERIEARPRACVAAVGPGTARALREAGMPPDLVASDPRAEGLAELLRRCGLAPGRALVVRPEVASEVVPSALEAMGAHVDAVAFYRTVAAPGAADAALALAEGIVDATVFGSPSAARALVAATEGAGAAAIAGLRRSARVAIGPVTAAALESLGIPAAAVAAAPTSDGIARAVEQALRVRPPL